MGQTSPRLLVKRLPVQRGPNALQVLGCGGQPAWYVPKEDEGEFQLPCQIIRHRDGSGHGLGEEAAIGTQSTELHGEAPALGLAAAPEDFGVVAVREGPVSQEFLRTRIVREHEGREATAGEGAGLRRRERAWRQHGLNSSRCWHQGDE